MNLCPYCNNAMDDNNNSEMCNACWRANDELAMSQMSAYDRHMAKSEEEELCACGKPATIIGFCNDCADAELREWRGDYEHQHAHEDALTEFDGLDRMMFGLEWWGLDENVHDDCPF